MLFASARGVAPGDERETAAGLESHDEKFQTGECEKGEPLGRCKNGFSPLPSLKFGVLFVKCIIPIKPRGWLWRKLTSNQMPDLAFGQGGFGFAQWDDLFFRGQKILQETGFVVAAAALVIAPERFGHGFRIQLQFDG